MTTRGSRARSLTRARVLGSVEPVLAWRHDRIKPDTRHTDP